MNTIKNNPVTVDDINIAEKVYGPDIGSLKGKTTRRKPKPVVKDYVEIQRELKETHQDVELAIDTMFVQDSIPHNHFQEHNVSNSPTTSITEC